MITLKTNFDINKYNYKSAVYKVKFDTGHFYIGVTQDLKNRAIAHKTSLKDIKHHLTKKAVDLGSKEAEMIIVQTFGKVGKEKNLHQRLEQDLIVLNTRNPLMLNGRNSHLLKLDSL